MKWRTVQACDLSALESIWRKLPHTTNFYGKLEGKSLQDFIRAMQESCLIFELPFGFIRVEHLVRPGQTWIHGGFWSRDVFREIPFLRKLALHIMEIMGTDQLNIAIPVTGRGLPHIVEQVGFKWRGTLPGFYMTEDGCYDALLYVMIKEEEANHG